MSDMTRTRAALAGLVAMLSVAATATPAHAETWTTFDTDNISRSVPSERAWTVGSFTWQKDNDLYTDFRGSFAVDLHVGGGNPNDCAHLRILTYYKSGGTGTATTLSKRFPAAGTTAWGYYTFCQADGRGSKSLSGADIVNSGVPSPGQLKFDRAEIRVCATGNSSIPPGSDCYFFTIHPGD